jgi:hypothetical protein
MSLPFQLVFPELEYILFYHFCNFLSSGASSRIQTLDLRIIGGVVYHSAAAADQKVMINSVNSLFVDRNWRALSN